MRVCKFKFPDHEAIYNAIGARPDLCDHIYTEEAGWNMDMESAPLATNGTIAAGIRAAAHLLGVPVVETALDAGYRFARTNADETFDGFGTIRLGFVPSTCLWDVAIRRDAWDWQTRRYSSGGNTSWEEVTK